MSEVSTTPQEPIPDGAAIFAFLMLGAYSYTYIPRALRFPSCIALCLALRYTHRGDAFIACIYAGAFVHALMSLGSAISRYFGFESK